MPETKNGPNYGAKVSDMVTFDAVRILNVFLERVKTRVTGVKRETRKNGDVMMEVGEIRDECV